MNNNSFSVKINDVERLIGFATNTAIDGQSGSIIERGFFISDQREFYDYIDKISRVFLTSYVNIDSICGFLILIHRDLSAEVYPSGVSLSIEMWSKKKINTGDLVRKKDIADVKELRFTDVEIKEDDNLIFCFKKGWKFGLYFNFMQSHEEIKLNVNSLYNDLGWYYKYLTFQEDYSVFENELEFKKMYNDGWFPFLQLLGGDFKKLSNIYKNYEGEKRAKAVGEFINGFAKEELSDITEKWWKHEIFNEKKHIINAGLDAYLSNTDNGNINCIKTLYSEIEGIVRMCFYNEKKENPNFQKLLSYVKDKANMKFGSINSLTFPNVFYNYLDEIIFCNFDLKSDKVELSRHTASHGIAKPEDYTRIKAFQAILVLDQMFFFLL